MNNIFIKSFSDLTKEELYNILSLRSEVFIVEQNCIYQDIDHKDQLALHVFLKKNNQIIAYTRIFKPNDYFKHSSIGRVVVLKKERESKIMSYISTKKSTKTLPKKKSRKKKHPRPIPSDCQINFFIPILTSEVASTDREAHTNPI